MKMSLLAVLLASICCVVVPIQGQTERKDSGGNKANASNTASPQPAASPSPTVAIGSPVEQNTSQEQGEGTKGQSKGYFGRLLAPENLPNIILCLIGIAGIITALLTLNQIEVQAKELTSQNEKLERSVTLAETTAERQLRAYIGIASGLVLFRKPGIPEAQVEFANYGQTPAYDVESWIHMWIEEYPLKVTLPEPPDGFEMSKSVIFPGAQPHSLFIEKRPPVPEESRGWLCSAKGTIYVYGVIRYRDAFGKQQFTHYRLFCGGDKKPVTFTTKDGDNVARLGTYLTGNEAT